MHIDTKVKCTSVREVKSIDRSISLYTVEFSSIELAEWGVAISMSGLLPSVAKQFQIETEYTISIKA